MRFQDDPLRVLRAAQFVGRFSMTIDPESCVFMRTVAPRLQEIVPERVWEEWKKLLLKSPRPSRGIVAADELGILDALHGDIRDRLLLADHAIVRRYSVTTDPWSCMLARVDGVLAGCRADHVGNDESLVMAFAAIAHGMKAPRNFLERVGAKKESILIIERMLAEHDRVMEWFVDEMFDGRAISDGEIRRLAARLKPATIRQLALYIEGSYRGDMTVEGPREREHVPFPREHNPARTWLYRRAVVLQCENGVAPDCISGKEWLAHLNAKGGKELGTLITLANDLRDDRGITSAEILHAIPVGTTLSEAVHILGEMKQQKNPA
jgi:tRNA nucleotidyltransferase (CCA-adding enzyme)